MVGQGWRQRSHSLGLRSFIRAHSAGKFLECLPPIPRSCLYVAGQVQAEEINRWGAKLKIFLRNALSSISLPILRRMSMAVEDGA